MSTGNNAKKHFLALTDEEADTLRAALDLYARIGIGQLDRIDDHMDHWPAASTSGLLSRLLEAREALCGHLGKGRSIGNRDAVPNRFRVAWDISQMLRVLLTPNTQFTSTRQVADAPVGPVLPASHPLSAVPARVAQAFDALDLLHKGFDFSQVLVGTAVAFRDRDAANQGFSKAYPIVTGAK